MISVYFTNREKTILKLLTEYTNEVTLSELESILNVSRRTVYREISNVETTLEQFHLELTKQRGRGFQLVGSSADMNHLKDQLNGRTQLNFDKAERQHALSALLFLGNDMYFPEILADNFEVSLGTIQTDIEQLNRSFSDYDLKIVQDRAKGLVIKGEESVKRQVWTHIFSMNINEYDFFEYLDELKSDQTKEANQYFIQIIDKNALYLANWVMKEVSGTILKNVTDNQIQYLLLNLSISIHRIKQGHMISKSMQAEKVESKFLKLAHKIYQLIEKELGLGINFNEQLYLANQFVGINYKNPKNIFFDTFDVEISYKIREFIRLTSDYTGYEFRNDEILYDDLYAHLSSFLKRPASFVSEDENPLLNNIINEYSTLYNEVVEAFDRVFPDENATKLDIAYIVIHFASSLERSPAVHNISMLVICSSGVGTAKILENRIKKRLPEVKNTEVTKVSQMKAVNFNNFDVILSTIYLPKFDHPYLVVSPLLLDDEIEKVKGFIDKNVYAREVDTEDLKPEVQSISTFDKIYQLTTTAQTLLKNFDVSDVKSEETLEDTLLEILSSLEDQVVSDAGKVAELVVKRYLEAPVGIPDSNIALLHSTNEWVKEPYFAIFDLDQSFSILGMDKRSIELNRILLLLAPEPLTAKNQVLLGRISSSIIDSDLNIGIYSQESKAKIYQLLSQLFVNEIKEVE